MVGGPRLADSTLSAPRSRFEVPRRLGARTLACLTARYRRIGLGRAIQPLFYAASFGALVHCNLEGRN